MTFWLIVYLLGAGFYGLIVGISTGVHAERSAEPMADATVAAVLWPLLVPCSLFWSIFVREPRRI